MPDMLVKLYDLPKYDRVYDKLATEGIKIIRPMTPNKRKVVEWARTHFNDDWADEISTAFTHFPVSCFIAYDENQKKMVGFAGYDCTYRNFFGPTGVDETMRGKGIGGALFMRCMEAMRDEGYAYAIIGSIGPKEFYERMVGATIIEGSDPGIYKDLF